ncbi:DUF371 domain-containing protein [Methanococcus aeolicus]|uniref:DUF371 domain-containing protein n=1 Tax=Methanococcus aeolicus (strain ATCC BAA-1280 / DSM 17508 / OCM 812 / Nankai-3) TaxID=419665 RepID=A6UTA3_META3|nr:DUF371 domain-containing protein [Methanococcus aeolicus]ABR55725.1 Protein of unknown function DUF371 [Methanococcus aeolicus Nankai-3]UXM85219.1 DUF371 domain-containing protein [Methanococcus aeolicus]
MEITIVGTGHKNINATHKTTLEITKEPYLTPTGDCIVGINIDKSMVDFSEEIREKIRSSDKIIVEIIVGDLKETIVGKGHKDLILNHPTDIVIRKSNFICPRTLIINADKSANDLNREIVERLKKGENLIFKIIIL